MSLYEKIALYSIADVAVVTATRDGMNLVPYEYIVCRQGAPVCHSSQSVAQRGTMCVVKVPQYDTRHVPYTALFVTSVDYMCSLYNHTGMCI